MAKAHERILEIDATVDGDDVEITGVRYYRDRAKQQDGDGFDLEFTAGPAGPATELEFGQLAPPPTHVRLNVDVVGGGGG